MKTIASKPKSRAKARQDANYKCRWVSIGTMIDYEHAVPIDVDSIPFGTPVRMCDHPWARAGIGRRRRGVVAADATGNECIRVAWDIDGAILFREHHWDKVEMFIPYPPQAEVEKLSAAKQSPAPRHQQHLPHPEKYPGAKWVPLGEYPEVPSGTMVRLEDNPKRYGVAVVGHEYCDHDDDGDVLVLWCSHKDGITITEEGWHNLEMLVLPGTKLAKIVAEEDGDEGEDEE